MEIKLGMPVRTLDGERIGTVDRLVLDPDSRDLLEIIVHQGHILTRDRIVDRIYLSETDIDGTVYLNLTAAQAEELPPFTAHEHIVSAGPDAGSGPLPYGAPTMDMSILWRSRPTASHGRHTSERRYEAAVGDAASVYVHPNLPQQSVTVGRGTDVIDSDDHKLGTVEEVDYASDGEISALVVRTGHLRHEHLRVRRDWIAVITHNRVRLSVTEARLRAENERLRQPEWSKPAIDG